MLLVYLRPLMLVLVLDNQPNALCILILNLSNSEGVGFYFIFHETRTVNPERLSCQLWISPDITDLLDQRAKPLRSIERHPPLTPNMW